MSRFPATLNDGNKGAFLGHMGLGWRRLGFSDPRHMYAVEREHLDAYEEVSGLPRDLPICGRPRASGFPVVRTTNIDKFWL